ncbi:unnamed protein product [Triticum turgidum subsp. durum]|uniref:Uncharacterized protein n=1 Tax=Triticum turgidum subsp. durum TaxID=4567 RepID=A0A9R0R1W1_TRITD|nr:unnamed protein product [Triticum turgidum subsp. durum]
MSSWVGASVLGIGEWIIKRMPLVRHIYNASKQISAAISPDQNKQAFKEAIIIRHPRIGEYAFGFITSSVSLQVYYTLHCYTEFPMIFTVIPGLHIFFMIFLYAQYAVMLPCHLSRWHEPLHG